MSAPPAKGQLLVALFGDPVVSSLSPAVHNAAFLACGLRWAYIPFRADAATLPRLFARLRGEGLAGANFTYPCKTAAAAFCDQLSPEAARLRAVNTIRITGAGVEGFNTDVSGFAAALAETALDVGGRDALVLGAGAAARAVGVALEDAGAAVAFACREVTAAGPGISPRATVLRLADAPAFLSERRPAVLVNATPIGLGPDDAPLFDYGVIPAGTFVWELNYGRETALLAAARERKLAAADGLGMLLHQAARAFELWTGQEAPLAVMRRAADDELRRRQL
jgi:shikimate dehydrogenase